MRVIIVDDNTTNLAILCSVVGKIPNVDVQGFADPKGALANIASDPVDLVVVDYVMPVMNGIEFLKRARALPQLEHVPMVMLTADSEQSLKQDAVAAGASDFLNKPVNPLDLRARVTNLLALRSAQVEVERAGVDVGRPASAIDVLSALGRMMTEFQLAAGTRGAIAGPVARLVSGQMGLSADICEQVAHLTTIRDLGMFGAPAFIRDNLAALSEADLDIMGRHTEAGVRIIGEDDNELMSAARDVVRSRHERWDGAGYPKQLKGSDIPLTSRIIAVADAFTAMISDRPTRPALSADAARAQIVAEAGRQFDPACVAAFERGWPSIVGTLHAVHLDVAA